jgi:hypothetical protein
MGSGPIFSRLTRGRGKVCYKCRISGAFSQEGLMNRFYPHRNDFTGSKPARFIAVFWAYLLTIYLLSFWT